MNDWFRSWHGAPTDPKWLGIARRVDVPAGIVAAVAWALMDRASQATNRGSIDGYDADALGAFFGCDAEQVEAIVTAMTDKGIIDDGRFTAWGRRQPKREDRSTERVREHRKRTVTQRNAATRTETLDTDTDTDKISPSLRSGDTRASGSEPSWRIEFDMTFWPTYPHKVGKPKALSAFLTARKSVDLDVIMAGLQRYIRDKPPDRSWLNPATFLNQERFNDEPAAEPTDTAKRPHDAIFAALAKKAAGEAGNGRGPPGANGIKPDTDRRDEPVTLDLSAVASEVEAGSG